MKKFLAQLVISITINTILINVAYSDEGDLEPSENFSEELLELGDPYIDENEGEGTAALLPCIQEFKIDENGDIDPTTPGPDEGYIITIIEEPLNIDPIGTTPTDDYVVRRCFRNTFNFTDPISKETTTLPMLANNCSNNAQNLMIQWSGAEADAEHKKYSVKYSCNEVQVSLCKGGTACLYGYIGTIYRWGASLVGIIAVAVIILSGIQISAAGGDPEAVGSAKKRITQSIIGIVVLFLSGLILYTVNPTFFVK